MAAPVNYFVEPWFWGTTFPLPSNDPKFPSTPYEPQQFADALKFIARRGYFSALDQYGAGDVAINDPSSFDDPWPAGTDGYVATFTVDDVVAFITRQLEKNLWISFGTPIFVVVLPHGSVLDSGELGAHSTFSHNGNTVIWAWMYGMNELGVAMRTATHEIVESIGANGGAPKELCDDCGAANPDGVKMPQGLIVETYFDQATNTCVAPGTAEMNEFLAGVSVDGTIQAWQFNPVGGWTTSRIDWASVVGSLTSWVVGDVWHLGAIGTDGNVYVLWQSPGQDWQAVNVSESTQSSSGVQGPLTSWVVGQSEFLAGVNADGTIQVWQFTPAGGWTTGRIGWASVVGPLTSWVAGDVWHLAAAGSDGNTYVLWQSPGQDWRAVNASGLTGMQIRPGFTAWQVGDVEHLAGVDATDQPVVLWWSPAHDWQATKTVAGNEPLRSGLQSWTAMF